jgi:pyroglutamyl-peptidase
MTRILVAGFGGFPGAPINPTVALIAALKRRRRPALAAASIATHVFPTRYAAVDEELPALLAREKPGAVVLFGVAGKAKRLRIERLARNRASVLFPDAGGAKPSRAMIAAGAPPFRSGRLPLARLLAACRSAGVPATVSRNAGTYLCNYAYWRALEAAQQPDGPRLVVFVHIPPPRKFRPRSRGRGGKVAARLRSTKFTTLADLTRAAEAILVAVKAELLRDAEPA